MHERRIRQIRPDALAIERKNKELRQKGLPPIDIRRAQKPENEIEIHSPKRTGVKLPANIGSMTATGASAVGAAGTPVVDVTADVVARDAAGNRSTASNSAGVIR